MRNIEVKVRLSDVASALKLAREISDKREIVMNQVDTYFRVQDGRLKLREFEDQDAELIFYDRPNAKGPKLSSYIKQKFSNNEATNLKKMLQSSIGVVGTVHKKRHLFMVEQTRIHIDDVQQLGHFMEFEVVLKEIESIEYGQGIAEQLMSRFNVSENDLICESYINLLSKTGSSTL